MLDFLIGFLQKVKQKKQNGESRNSKGTASFILLLLFACLVLFLFVRLAIALWNDIIPGDVMSGLHRILIWVIPGIVVLTMIFLILSLFAKYKTRKTQLPVEFKPYLIYVPIMITLLALFFHLVPTSVSDVRSDARRIELLIRKLFGASESMLYLIAFMMLLVYPVIAMLQNIRPKWNTCRWLEKIKKIFGVYNLGYFFILSIVGTLFVLIRPNAWGYYLSDGPVLLTVIVFLIYIILYTYPLFALRAYVKEIGRANISKGVISFIAVGVITSILPYFYSAYMNGQIVRSNNILEEGGLNYKTFKKAKTLFLDKAYLQYFNDTKRTTSDSFQKLYDATPENYYGEKLKGISSTATRATNASKVGENADVILKMVEVENVIISTGTDMDVMESTYKFHFANTTNVNQEVKINFETPSIYSVISDLKLGLYGELQGIIASRGAAAQVYADSLRINRDPALLQKVGMSTYSLSVFPILSQQDSKTQGRQLVQLTILTPLQKGVTTTYSPQISMTNLKTDDTTSLISKIYQNTTLLKEDTAKAKSVDSYLQIAHQLPSSVLDVVSDKTLADYCIPTDMLRGLQTTWLEGFSGEKLTQNLSPKTKTSLFFDNSLSVERNGANEAYQSLFNAVKNYNGQLQDVDLYAYNFAVEKVTSVDDIQHRGYSDIDGLIDFIEKNNITNQRIIIVTDDDGYNKTVTENKKRNYKSLLTNQIDIIKIGDAIKTYKSDFTNLIAATNGNIYNFVDGNVSTILQGIYENKGLYIHACEGALTDNIIPTGNIGMNVVFTGGGVFTTRAIVGSGFMMTGDVVASTGEKTDIEKILAGYVGNRMLGMIEGEGDWIKVANFQSTLAKKYTIVNQFNSMIALETAQQYRDLQRYENQGNKYDSVYSNNQTENTTTTRPTVFNDESPRFTEMQGTNRGFLDNAMDSGIDIPGGAVFNDGVDLDLGRGSSVGRYWYRRDLGENTALWFSAGSSLGDGIYLDDYLEDYSFGIVLLLIIIYVVQIRYFVDVFYSVFFKKHEQEQPTPNSQ